MLPAPKNSGVVIDDDAGRTMSKEAGSRSDPRKMPFTLLKSKVSLPALLSLKLILKITIALARLGLLCVSPSSDEFLLRRLLTY